MRKLGGFGGALMGLLLLTGTLGAADVGTGKKFRVQVNINGEEDIKGNLAKLLQEEFIALTDVELVPEKPEWTLELIGFATRNEKKEPVVFLVSVLATQQFPRDYWNGVYATLTEAVLTRQHELKDKEKKPFVSDKKKIEALQPAWTVGESGRALEAKTENMVRKQAHYVEGGNDLKAMAKKIVGTFNQDQLDPRRKK
ncbi:MAG TPA: hypothetical protein VI337_00750 [Nitrospirales bacterium]|nr:hypothetical protein [Nitrospirales bacterium]